MNIWNQSLILIIKLLNCIITQMKYHYLYVLLVIYYIMYLFKFIPNFIMIFSIMNMESVILLEFINTLQYSNDDSLYIYHVEYSTHFRLKYFYLYFLNITNFY
jgi:hypothetical protein